MTPDDLPLPPAKRDQLQAQLASAGVPDGLQTCCDEAAATVSFYTAGFTVSTTLTEGWTKTIALHLAYTRAGSGLPKAIEDAAKSAMTALEAVRDGKFAAAAPSASVGAAVTEDAVIDDTLR